MPDINRRSFLKLAGAATSAVLLPRLVSGIGSSLKQNDASIPNIIILLFDAMSARNLSVYGYPRPTASNLERFAERATVYHYHSAVRRDERQEPLSLRVPTPNCIQPGALCRARHCLPFSFCRRQLHYSWHCFAADRHLSVDTSSH